MRSLLWGIPIVVMVACSSGTLVRAPMTNAKDPVASTDAGLSTADAELLSGKWSGNGVQSNGRRWDLTLDVGVTDGQVAVRVVYPSSGCGGEWRLSPRGVHEWVGEESIAYGTSSCVDHGQVVVRVSGDTLEFDWRDSVGSLTAHGTLRRVRR